MVGLNIFHCCLASYLSGFEKEKFPRIMCILIKLGSVHYWSFKLHRPRQPVDDRTYSYSANASGGGASKGEDISQCVKEEILDSVSAHEERSSKKVSPRNGSRFAAHRRASDDSIPEKVDDLDEAEVLTEESFYNWKEACFALDVIGRFFSALIFVIVMCVLYAQIP
jgi:hypothetical protein